MHVYWLVKAYNLLDCTNIQEYREEEIHIV